MKKLFTYLLLAPVLIASFVLFTTPLYAQPIEVPKMEMKGQEATSGFVDENGKPLSQSEYDKINAELEKGFIEKYPIVVYAVGGGIIGAVVWLVVNKTGLAKKNKNSFLDK